MLQKSLNNKENNLYRKIRLSFYTDSESNFLYLGDFDITGRGGFHERRVSVLIMNLSVDSVFQQDFHNLPMKTILCYFSVTRNMDFDRCYRYTKCSKPIVRYAFGSQNRTEMGKTETVAKNYVKTGQEQKQLTLVCPLVHAAINGVFPFGDSTLTSAPCLMSSSTISAWPCCAASYKAIESISFIFTTICCRKTNSFC